MEFSEQLLKGYIDIILISIIKKHRTYGYDIAKTISRVTENEFQIKDATMYLALKRLEKNKYIQSEWDNSNGGARRKYYEITPSGIEYIENRKKEIEFIKKIIDVFISEE